MHRITGVDVALWTCGISLSYDHWPLPGWPIKKSGVSAMDPVMDRFLVRVRVVFAVITDLSRKLFGMNRRDFAAQRMCPFCGLITSRRKMCCLECGRLLKPA